MFRPICTALFLCLLIVTSGRPALAADPEPSATPDRVGRAQELIASIDQQTAELVAIFDRVPDAEGEERELLTDQGLRRREIIFRELGELVSLVASLRADEREVPEIERGTEQTLSRLSSAIADRLPARKRLLVKLRRERDAESGESYDELDRVVRSRQGWIDESFDSYGTMIRYKEKLGIDAAADRAFLEAEIEKHAELRGSQLRIASRRLEEARREASEYEGARAEEARQAMVPLRRKVDELTASVSRAVAVMSSLDMDATEYRQLLLQVTGQVTAEALDAKAIANLVRDWFDSGVDWVRINGGSLVVRLLVLVAILTAFRAIAGAARRLVDRGLSGPKVRVSQLLREFLLMAAYRGVWLIGILVALSQLGIEIAPLLAGLGVAGFIVGFALQNSLSNFASGLMILAYRPFDVGDFIEAAGVSGVAKQLNLVSTTVVTFDNRRLIVPNTKIWEDVIVNVTAERVRRVDLVFGIGYGDDIEKAEGILEAIIAEHPKILDEPEPVVRLHNLGDSSVDFIVRPWVETKSYWEVYWDVTRKVKERFDAEGISIPFPQRDVHFYPEQQSSVEDAPAKPSEDAPGTATDAAPAAPPEDDPSAD